jgi:hypothetical protein
MLLMLSFVLLEAADVRKDSLKNEIRELDDEAVNKMEDIAVGNISLGENKKQSAKRGCDPSKTTKSCKNKGGVCQAKNKKCNGKKTRDCGASCKCCIEYKTTEPAATTASSTATTSTEAAITTVADVTTSTEAAITTVADVTTSTEAAITTVADVTTSTEAAITTVADVTTSTESATTETENPCTRIYVPRTVGECIKYFGNN